MGKAEAGWEAPPAAAQPTWRPLVAGTVVPAGPELDPGVVPQWRPAPGAGVVGEPDGAPPRRRGQPGQPGQPGPPGLDWNRQ
jgi:hypothetical protein